MQEMCRSRCLLLVCGAALVAVVLVVLLIAIAIDFGPVILFRNHRFLHVRHTIAISVFVGGIWHAIAIIIRIN